MTNNLHVVVGDLVVVSFGVVDPPIGVVDDFVVEVVVVLVVVVEVVLVVVVVVVVVVVLVVVDVVVGAASRTIKLSPPL